MKKIFGIISIICGILLVGGVALLLIIGSTIAAFQGHWILGAFMVILWTGVISFYIHENL